jgi:hypothetical protein
MCFQKQAARDWMERIVDFIFSETDIDGLGMQAADLGRCICDECAKMPDTEYYAAVSAHTARYIKSKYPDKTVSVSGWGMSYADAGDALAEMGKTVDYATDVTESALENKSGRAGLIKKLRCGFGTVGGCVVVPPHTWDRLAWFLPHAMLNGGNIQSLAKDGGAAFEYFTGVLSNPGDEVTLKAIGYLLNHPGKPVETAVSEAVRESFGPAAAAVCDELSDIFILAEKAYFDNIEHPLQGEFDFEPLFAVEPGEPIYLINKNREGLIRYRAELISIAGRLAAVENETAQKEKIRRSVAAIRNVCADVEKQINV